MIPINLLLDVDQLLNKTNLFTRSLVVKSTTLTLNFFWGGEGGDMIDMMILAVNDKQKFRKKLNILNTSILSNYLLIDPSLLFFINI